MSVAEPVIAPEVGPYVVSPRVRALLAMAPGPELLSALSLLSGPGVALTQADRLMVAHLCERAVGWVQHQASTATVEQAGRWQVAAASDWSETDT